MINIQLSNTTSLSNAEILWLVPILSKFLIFSKAKNISAIDYFVVPVGGDRSYIIFQVDDIPYVLVTADYPDPLNEAEELKELSSVYTFTHVVTPVKNSSIKIQDTGAANIDNVEDDFLIKLGVGYCYCAPVQSI